MRLGTLKRQTVPGRTGNVELLLGVNRVSIGIDWRAYYDRFKEEHGLPIEHRGRALFPDGWQYSLTSYSGPEYPPPEPVRLKYLQLIYWHKRHRIVRHEMLLVSAHVDHLVQIQGCRSVPLQQDRRDVAYGDGAYPRLKRTGGDLELDDLRGRIDWLKKDLIECDQRLQELKGAKDVGRDSTSENPAAGCSVY